ncbi:MAG: hypothetical protein CBC13_07450 [Planctomycetia bacterium TMED53]|nr:MAG: hypothetical protein CBC13_07450 [Planctomycetia bacterium TMED53]
MSSDAEDGFGEKWTLARSALDSSRRVSVFTGAGMSAESGIPTFRGEDGLWKGRRPEEWATPEAFLESPAVVREFYQWRRDLISGVNPHAGHLALGSWAKAGNRAIDVVTQNVDGFHQLSGCPSVLELHGSLWSQHCHVCQHSETDVHRVSCHCGGPLRPSVVWFGEVLPQDVWRQAEEVIRHSEAMLVIGTSAVVYPAASLVFAALERSVPVIEINPQPVLGDPAICISGTAAKVLPQLLKGL